MLDCFVLLEDLSTSLIGKKLLEQLIDKEKASRSVNIFLVPSETVTPTKILSRNENSVEELKSSKKKLRPLYTFRFEYPSDAESVFYKIL
nr:uncharacterized protein LOC121116309 isoform X3 [Lepeophtheirus salmonis]